MEMETLKVRVTGGSFVNIQGKPHGLFLVHENEQKSFLEGEFVPVWSVTHIKTGARFPWGFLTEEAATAFADDVLPLMNWEGVETKDPDDSMKVKAVWVACKPTKEQTMAIKNAYKRRGGFACGNQTR